MNFKQVDRSELVKWIGFTVIAIILIFFLVKFMQFIARIFTDGDAEKQEENKQLAQSTPDHQLQKDGGDIRDSFNPAIYANDLKKVNTETYFWTVDARKRCRVYERVMTELNNNERIKVNDYYKNEFNRLLRADLKDIVTSGCYLWETDWHTKLSENLDKLELV